MGIILKCCLYNRYRTWLRLVSPFYSDSGEHQAFSWSLAGALQSTTSRWTCIFSPSLGHTVWLPAWALLGLFSWVPTACTEQLETIFECMPCGF